MLCCIPSRVAAGVMNIQCLREWSSSSQLQACMRRRSSDAPTDPARPYASARRQCTPHCAARGDTAACTPAVSEQSCGTLTGGSARCRRSCMRCAALSASSRSYSTTSLRRSVTPPAAGREGPQRTRPCQCSRSMCACASVCVSLRVCMYRLYFVSVLVTCLADTCLPCPALPCPALPCPALPCPALPCPACLPGSVASHLPTYATSSGRPAHIGATCAAARHVQCAAIGTAAVPPCAQAALLARRAKRRCG
jgi:hypothetical protein